MTERGVKRCALALLLLLAAARPAAAQAPPAGLPRYGVSIALDVAARIAKVRQRITWTNTGTEPTDRLVLNAHAHYSIPDGDVGKLAKMVEILRMAPSEALSFDGPALEVQQIAEGDVEADAVRAAAARPGLLAVGRELKFFYAEDNPTALVVPLGRAVSPGQAVTITLDFTMKLPARKGRWGQWGGITTLAQWLPVLAVYGRDGWDPAPFIPWHQPFHNEAGVYDVRLKVPAGQKVAASAALKSATDLGDGWTLHEYQTACVRDFSIVCSDRFREWTSTSDGIAVRVLALPEHEHYAKVLLETVCDAIPVYNRWFGRYPYPQFTVVEACFGWNGNECGSLVMIDDRMMNMPHIARNYPTYLMQHELCHQWWYNVVGTNGYAETWMDEGLATHFSHRLADLKAGKNNELITYPTGLGWLPNIHRDDLRNYTYLGARARGNELRTVAPLPEYEHLVNLTSAAYDRGSKVIGMIEERLGREAFLDFARHIFRTYRFRILRVADFQRELEAFTGHSWDDFFHHWVWGSGMCDWSLRRVTVHGDSALAKVLHPRRRNTPTVRVVVHLRQQGGFNEPTVLGFRLPGNTGYTVRVPIHPGVPVLVLDELKAKVECRTRGNPRRPKECRTDARVEIELPCAPEQVSVDPDGVLLDSCPTNNHWKAKVRWRLTPLYTQLDDADVTNSYDRWNILFGPWIYFSSWSNPWYVTSPLAGVRLGVYRTQVFAAGAYLAYRSNDRNLVVGADALWDHVLLPQLQLGLEVQRNVATLGPEDIPSSRGVGFARYVLMPGSALYLPPFEYIEAFGVAQNRSLPLPRVTLPGAELFSERSALGLHYHKNYLTPYWDAEGGMALDLTYQYGMPIFGNQHDYQMGYGQLSWVKSMPRLLDHDGPVLDWLYATRWAFRVGGAAAVPTRGQFFALGGGDQFRGFDLAERQGSMVWLGSVEWRVPVARGLGCDVCDHVAGLRNLYLAPFYDVGNAYLSGKALGPTAHALGAGLRADVTWLGLIERTMLRFDFAKTVGSNAPWQFWFGIQHPF